MLEDLFQPAKDLGAHKDCLDRETTSFDEKWKWKKKSLEKYYDSC